jgi:hypothetical protein
MIPTVAPNIARAATNGMVISSPSMKGLLFIISTVSGLPSRKRLPGAVGLPNYGYAWFTHNKNAVFTLVKTNPVRTICGMFLECFKYIMITRSGALLGLVPLSTSGKYRDSASPIPGGIAFRVSYRRSVQGIASKGKCLISWPIWRSLVFPVALSCKAQIVVSYLL